MEVVKNSWNQPMYGEYNPMLHFFRKLKRLKGHLRDWNKASFGNIFQNIHTAEDDVLRCQYNLELGWSEDRKIALEEAKAKLERCLLME